MDGGALPQGPFIPALGSALRCEPGPGHLDMRGPPPATYMVPVTGDDWQLLPASLHGAQGIPSTSATSFSLHLSVPHTFVLEFGLLSTPVLIP